MENPRHGGRVLLEREEVRDHEVRYRVTLFSPNAEWRSAGTIHVDDGRIELGAFDAEEAPPEWLVEGARAFLRTVWSGRRGEADPRWPRRVLRWRNVK